jgi:hypothetical protein
METASPRLPPPQQLLVVGLCGESITVDWLPQDAVKDIKDRAYAAAQNTALANGRASLVTGASSHQLCLVFGEPDDAIKLEDASTLADCLHALRPDPRHLRPELRLASAANDLDGFVEIELDAKGRYAGSHRTQPPRQPHAAFNLPLFIAGP